MSCEKGKDVKMFFSLLGIRDVFPIRTGSIIKSPINSHCHQKIQYNKNHHQISYFHIKKLHLFTEELTKKSVVLEIFNTLRTIANVDVKHTWLLGGDDWLLKMIKLHNSSHI